MSMKKFTTRELAKQVIDELGSEFILILGKFVRLIAKGQLLTVKGAAESLNMPIEKTEALLARYGGEFDKKGNLIGLGLTTVPTSHVFKVNGRRLYTWCAFDTLLFPMILGKTAHVESIDPISGAKIRLTVTPHGIQSIEPKTSVLSWPIRGYSSDVRGTFCDFTHFFSSPEIAEKYASNGKGILVLTISEVFEVVETIIKEINP